MKYGPRILAVAVTLALALTTACAGKSPSGDGNKATGPGVTATEIVLGATATITGPFAGSCAVENAGVQGWLDHVNKQGGVTGRKIKWVVLDDGGDAQRGASNGQRLLDQENVLGFFGTCGSAGSVALLPLADSQNIPFLFPNSINAKILRPPHPTVFTIVPLYDQQLAAILPYLYSKLGVGNVGVVYLAGFDPALMPAINYVTSQVGGKVVADIPITAATSDWSPVVIRLRNAGADYVVLAGTTPGAGQLVAEMARQGFKPSKAVVGAYQMADDIYVKTAGSAAEGTYAAAPVVPASDPRAKVCNDTLPAGTQPSFYTVLGCAFAQLMVTALSKAGTNPTRDSLLVAVKGMRNVDLKIAPTFSYADNHLLSNGVMAFQVKNGGFVAATPSFIPMPAEKWSLTS